MWNGLDGEDEVEGYDKVEQIFFFQNLRNVRRAKLVERKEIGLPKTVDFFMSLNIYANFYTIIK